VLIVRNGKIVLQESYGHRDIEDQSLFFDTENGIVLISGCGHAGLANTLDYLQKIYPGRPIYKIIGGFHLLKLTNDKLEWTAGKMREAGVNYFVGAHCTGLNSTYSIRNFLGLTSERALVGSVGTVITAKGIFPGYME
jgi:7,8-dihydropterin-6-yl-methyl-4-(beta-D-ribofuranosyl)aminobenzene 5'-phosphate synthase